MQKITNLDKSVDSEKGAAHNLTRYLDSLTPMMRVSSQNPRSDFFNNQFIKSRQSIGMIGTSGPISVLNSTNLELSLPGNYDSLLFSGRGNT